MRFSGKRMSVAELYVALQDAHPNTPVVMNDIEDILDVEIDAQYVRIVTSIPEGINPEVVEELLDSISSVTKSKKVMDIITSFRKQEGIE